MDRDTFLAWNASHLEQGGAHSTSSGTKWQNHFEEQFDAFNNLTWTGRGGDAAYEKVSRDKMTAYTAGDISSVAGAYSTTAAGDLTAMQQLVINGPFGMYEADAAGFSVEKNWSIKDSMFANGYPNQAIAATRNEQAQAFSDQIQYYLANFKGHLNTVAAQIDTHNAALQGVNTEDGTSLHNGYSTPHFSMVDNKFRLGGGDESPMPDIGDEHLGGGGGRTPLEDGLGGPAGPPNDWWKYDPQEVNHCPVETAAKDVVNTGTSMIGEGALIAITPGEGPLALAGGAAIIGNLANIGDNLDKLGQCIDQGIEGFTE